MSVKSTLVTAAAGVMFMANQACTVMTPRVFDKGQDYDAQKITYLDKVQRMELPETTKDSLVDFLEANELVLAETGTKLLDSAAAEENRSIYNMVNDKKEVVGNVRNVDITTGSQQSESSTITMGDKEYTLVTMFEKNAEGIYNEVEETSVRKANTLTMK